MTSEAEMTYYINVKNIVGKLRGHLSSSYEL